MRRNFVLGQFIGGVNAMIAVLPLLLAVAKELKVAPTILVLPASVGSQVGLCALPIGMAASMYLLKNQMMMNVGCMETLGFWDLCLTRLPGILVTAAYVLLGGWKLLPKRELADTSALEGSENIIVKSTLPRWKEIAAYVIFLGSLIAMIFSAQLGISIALIATISAFLCPALGIITEKEMLQSVNWSLVFMMACVQNGMSALPIVCAIDASCLASYSTPMSAPSSLVAYQMGGYSIKEMVKFTFPLILISTVVSAIWIPFYFSIR